MNNTEDTRIIASVQRALNILALFDPQTPELGLTEIAAALDLHKSTVSGLIYTLEKNGYIEQNPDNRRYRLGLKLVERASILLNQIEIRQIALPSLHHLRDWSQESVNLAVREDNEVIYIERLLSDKNLGFRNEIGKRARVHSTALGKAILSHLPVTQANELLHSYTLESFTENTITDRETLMKQFETFRQQGYAIEREENELGGLCVSSPIFDHLGNPTAAVSISIPISRLKDDTVPTFGKKVRETAQLISQRLGYHPEMMASRVPSAQG